MDQLDRRSFLKRAAAVIGLGAGATLLGPLQGLGAPQAQVNGDGPRNDRVNQLYRAVNRETLSGAKALLATDPPLQYLDPGGETRTVTLPEGAPAGAEYVLMNTGSTGNLEVPTSGVTFTIPPGQAARWTASGDDEWAVT